MEVVVVGDGGDPEAGVMLGGGVRAIAVARVVRQAGLPVVREFSCFLILTLDTAHSLLSVGGERRRNEHTVQIIALTVSGGDTGNQCFIISELPLRVTAL